MYSTALRKTASPSLQRFQLLCVVIFINDGKKIQHGIENIACTVIDSNHHIQFHIDLRVIPVKNELGKLIFYCSDH